MRKVDAYNGFMGDLRKVHGYFCRLREEGAHTGIAFEFDGHTSSTFDAHRLAEWALDTHGADVQDRLVEEQFKQYMELGQPPNSRASQLAAAAAAGVDVDSARRVLEDRSAYAAATQAKLQAARAGGVSGVPCFRIDGQPIVTGAQSADFWEDALRQYLAHQRRAQCG